MRLALIVDVQRTKSGFPGPEPGPHDPMTTQPIKPPADAPAAHPDGHRVTLEMVRDHPRVKAYIRMADASLEQIGYTEHGERHVGLVSRIAHNVLKRLGYPERECELASIAGLLHDIGNAVNRDHHAQSGAVMAM